MAEEQEREEGRGEEESRGGAGHLGITKGLGGNTSKDRKVAIAAVAVGVVGAIIAYMQYKSSQSAAASSPANSYQYPSLTGSTGQVAGSGLSSGLASLSSQIAQLQGQVAAIQPSSNGTTPTSSTIPGTPTGITHPPAGPVTWYPGGSPVSPTGWPLSPVRTISPATPYGSLPGSGLPYIPAYPLGRAGGYPIALRSYSLSPGQYLGSSGSPSEQMAGAAMG